LRYAIEVALARGQMRLAEPHFSTSCEVRGVAFADVEFALRATEWAMESKWDSHRSEHRCVVHSHDIEGDVLRLVVAFEDDWLVLITAL